MIDSIELVNWKTHKDTKLKFAKGTNILLGPMGAGKSSIMDAISFALFGTYPAIQHRRVAVDEIIMNRPAQENRARVSLGFEIDGTKYDVERALDLRGTTKATIAKNGAYLQSQPQRVNEEVERILKVDYDLFSRAIYSEQNRLTYFLELRPTERKKQIDELLGLDKFATAQDNATTLANKMKDMIGESEKTIASFDLEKLKQQHRTLKDESSRLEKLRKELEIELVADEKKETEIEKALKSAKEAQSRKTVLAKEIGEIKSGMEVLEKEIAKISKKDIGDKGSLEKRVSATRSDLESAKKEEKESWEKEKASVQELGGLETEMKRANKDLAEREKLKKEYEKKKRGALEDTVKKADAELRKARSEKEANVASRNENQKWLAELKKHLSRCPICERDLPDEIRKRILEERESAIAKLDAQIEKQEKEATGLERGLEDAKRELDELNRVEEKLSDYGDLEKRAEALAESIAKAKSENQRLRARKEEAAEAVLKAKDLLAKLETDMEMLTRMEGYVSDKERSAKTLKQKEGEMDKIDVSEASIEKLQDEFTSLNASVKELSARLETNADAQKEKEKQVGEKEKEIGLIDKMHDEVKSRKKVVENIARFKEALEETQTALRTRLIGSINEIMQEIWPELYPYGDYQGILLEPTSEDYVLKVKTTRGNGANWENVDTIASGGEKSMACLAMRVAFALVLVPNLRWIILDEPTHNIDQRGLSKFVKAINEVLPRLVDQVFIITHDEVLKQAANARIYILSRNKEESGGTVVEAY